MLRFAFTKNVRFRKGKKSVVTYKVEPRHSNTMSQEELNQLYKKAIIATAEASCHPIDEKNYNEEFGDRLSETRAKKRVYSASIVATRKAIELQQKKVAELQLALRRQRTFYKREAKRGKMLLAKQHQHE